MTLRKAAFASAAPILVAVLVACGGDDDSKSSSKSSGQANTSGQSTREVELVKTVRPSATKLVEALRKNDLAASRAAYEEYDAGWNGIEVYTNVRDRKLYQEIEVDTQAKIGEALEAPSPNLASLVPQAELLAKKYDEVIAVSQKGPPLHPLFDDVAAVRIVRADLRIVTAALNESNVSKARNSFSDFKKGYPKAQPLIQQRSTTAEQETTAALNAAAAKFQQTNATADELKPLVATLTDRYNFGVNLLNAAARNADPQKKSFTEADTRDLATLNDVQNQLRESLAAWNAGNYSTAVTANSAANAAFQRVLPSLAAKNSDSPLKSALDTYAALANGPGDPKTPAANKAAIEAAAVAQQVIAGQFWTDPKLKDFLATLPKA
jgi:hypothetical protein